MDNEEAEDETLFRSSSPCLLTEWDLFLENSRKKQKKEEECIENLWMDNDHHPPIVRLMENDDDDMDTPYNPYTSEIPIPTCETKIEKITFIESVHKYSLVDHRGCYPNLILSGSKVYSYLDVFAKVSNKHPTLPIKEKLLLVHENLARNVLKEMGSAKFAPHVGLFRELFHQHLEQFTLGEYTKPLSYRERCLCFQQYQRNLGYDDPKEMTHFIQGSTYVKIEAWLIQPQTKLQLTEEELDLVLGYLQGELEDFPSIEPDSPLSRLLVQARQETTMTTFKQITADHIHDSFIMRPGRYGTKLHAYVECRLNGKTQEESMNLFLPTEPEEVEQVEAFFLAHPRIRFVHSEYRVGSFRHKICGSIDALWQEKVDGQYVLYDWKRVWQLMEDNRTKVIELNEHEYQIKPDAELAYSGDLVKYMIQLATYRKLLRLNGFRVSKTAYLVFFHPRQHGYKRLEIQLDRPFPMRGIAKSPMARVEEIFSIREQHIKECMS